MKFKSEIVTQASGSIGGTTYAHNRGGMYRRARSIPTNPNSTRQQAVRSYLASAVAAWGGTLTAANRESWEAWAANTPTTNSLGDALILTGQQAYIGAAVPRAQIGVAAPATGPTIYNRGEHATGIHGTINTTNNQIGVSAGVLQTDIDLMTPASDDGDLLIYLGRSVSPGTNFYKGPYQLAASVAVAATSSVINWTDDIADLTIQNPLAVGQRRPVRLVMAYDDGRTSGAYEAICPVFEDV